MGIVVCITMLLGLMALFRDWRKEGTKRDTAGFLGAIYTFAPALSVAMGLWNSLWYGLRHLNSFWGNTALASGIVMLLAGVILLLEEKAQGSPELATFHKKAGVIRLPVMIGLLASFLLYAVTLIQLNLGFEIIR